MFDGECGLCKAVVRFLLRRDTAVAICVFAKGDEAGDVATVAAADG